MEITAKCLYNLKGVTALLHLQLFKKANPKSRMILWSVIYGVLSLILLLEKIFWQAEVIHLLVLMAVVMLLMCYMYFVLPRQTYKAQGKLKDAENTYTFGENSVHIVSQAEQYTGEAQVEYGLFIKVYETSEYFFVFQTKNQVFLVDKSTIQGGTAEDIRSRLSGAVKKYVICKY